MPIKNGFILAAGKGSRMGPIGNELPKVLWPVFETTLVGLQINFLKQCGISDIWINTHHQAESLKSYLAQAHPEINILFESILLDSGGGIHNFIIESKVSDSFLAINSDQYIKIDQTTKQKFTENEQGQPSLLCAMPGSSPYSSLIIKAGKLISISKESNGPMFTGLSRINSAKILAKRQPSKFFETVCNYKNTDIDVVVCHGDFLDFGSPHFYRDSIKKLFDKLLGDENFLREWHGAGLIDSQKVNSALSSYACEQAEVFNFSGKSLVHHWPKGSIIIKEPDIQIDCESSCIVYGNILENL